MVTSHLERAHAHEVAPLAHWPDATGSSEWTVVAAFEEEAQARRATRALLDAGCLADQIRLDGPGGGPGSSWPVGPGTLIGGAVLSAAVNRVIPPGRRDWLRGALAVPALGLTALAALTALANPNRLATYPWRVTVRSRERQVNAGGIMRAFGARGVYSRGVDSAA
jgi:hypothetical protein